MVFSSVTFLCVFMPIVLLLHTFVQNQRARNVILLIASLIFYAWGEPVWILAMLFSTAVNYLCARFIDAQTEGKNRKAALAVGIIISLSALFYFKYAAFLINSFCSACGIEYAMKQPKLPIGISFYTFQIITYTVDVYRKKAPVQKNPFRLLLYVCLFPQLIAGPIVRYGDIAEALENRKVTVQGIGEGFFRFSLGLGKKVLLANIAGEILESLPTGWEGSFASAWISAMLFCLQLYFDFSGYSDMAIGLGRILGFRFLENFDAPFVSKSISEFWRRWHISLGTFFREYVYFPLGGNRVSTFRWIMNMLIVWGLTGIWHGANWTFIIWGALYGMLIIVEKLCKIPQRVDKSLHWMIFWRPITLVAIVIGWVLFRSPNMSYAIEYIKSMFGFCPGIGNIDVAMFWLGEIKLLLVVALLFSVPILSMVRLYLTNKSVLLLNIYMIIEGICLFVCFTAGVSYLAMNAHNPFIYFNF